MADGIRIPLGHITLDRLRMIDREESNRSQVVWGQCMILGVDFHVLAVRVTTDDEGTQVAVCDPLNRLDDINSLNEGYLEPVEIPTLDGEWVMAIFPHGRG